MHSPAGISSDETDSATSFFELLHAGQLVNILPSQIASGIPSSSYRGSAAITACVPPVVINFRSSRVSITPPESTPRISLISVWSPAACTQSPPGFPAPAAKAGSGGFKTLGERPHYLVLLGAWSTCGIPPATWRSLCRESGAPYSAIRSRGMSARETSSQLHSLPPFGIGFGQRAFP